MRSTLSSALANSLRRPLGSSASASKPFSSDTRLMSMSPTSPVSWVCTASRAVSEKSAIFFCASAPKSSTWSGLVTSSLPRKSSMAWRSAGVSWLSSSRGAAACCAGWGFSWMEGWAEGAGSGASGVRDSMGVRFCSLMEGASLSSIIGMNAYLREPLLL